MIVETMGKSYLNEWMIELMKRHSIERLKESMIVEMMRKNYLEE